MKLGANQKLIYRVACVVTYNNKVLLHRAEMDSFFALPGGSVEFGETSLDAAKREMIEELGATVEVGRLLWVVENFFQYMDKDCHEIGLYYHVHFSGDSSKLNNLNEFVGTEEHFIKDRSFKLFFKWFDMNEVANLDIRPAFLKEALQKIPMHTEVIINQDGVKELSI